MRRPVIGEIRAIIKAGIVKINLTRNSAFLLSENAITIFGKAGEMVMIDIIVRLLTKRSVNFNFDFLFCMMLFLLNYRDDLINGFVFDQYPLSYNFR